MHVVSKYPAVDFDKFLEIIPDATVVSNKQGEIVKTNLQAEKLFGYAPGELKNQSIEILMPARFSKRHVEHRKHYSESPGRVRPMGTGLDLLGCRKDGSEFPVDISLNRIETSEGPLTISIIRDISQLKQTEDELKKHAESLEALNHQMEKDLRLAAKTQHSIMKPIKDLPFLKTSLLHFPHSQVSGDIYDEIEDGNGHVNIFLGDVCGHGIQAALIAMMVEMGLISITPNHQPSEILSDLNRKLSSNLVDNLFVTAVCLKISKNGQLFLSNAGHYPAVVIPADHSAPVQLSPPGMALGLFYRERIPYQDVEYQLQRGDLVFICTDGVTECVNGNNVFGFERLVDLLKESVHLDLDKILAQVKAELQDFMEGSPFGDDVTMIGFEFKG